MWNKIKKYAKWKKVIEERDLYKKATLNAKNYNFITSCIHILCRYDNYYIIFFPQPSTLLDFSSMKTPSNLKVKLETVHEDGPSESSTDSIDKNQFTFTPSSKANSKTTTPTDPGNNDLLNIKP